MVFAPWTAGDGPLEVYVAALDMTSRTPTHCRRMILESSVKGRALASRIVASCLRESSNEVFVLSDVAGQNQAARVFPTENEQNRQHWWSVNLPGHPGVPGLDCHVSNMEMHHTCCKGLQMTLQPYNRVALQSNLLKAGRLFFGWPREPTPGFAHWFCLSLP